MRKKEPAVTLLVVTHVSLPCLPFLNMTLASAVVSLMSEMKFILGWG